MARSRVPRTPRKLQGKDPHPVGVERVLGRRNTYPGAKRESEREVGIPFELAVEDAEHFITGSCGNDDNYRVTSPGNLTHSQFVFFFFFFSFSVVYVYQSRTRAEEESESGAPDAVLSSIDPPPTPFHPPASYRVGYGTVNIVAKNW